MIAVRVRKHFAAGPGSAAFNLDIEFEAGPGVTALFGHSGAGKTLTLDAIAGLMAPDSGRIMLKDRILFDSGAGVNIPTRDRHCGYVFQSGSLFPHMTLRENLAFAAASTPRLERRRRIVELLERFRLRDLDGRYPSELSGGQAQRGAIARSLLAQPDILLLDEPARGLDQELRGEFYAAIEELRGLRMPVLVVTHGVEELFSLADQVLVYASGRILRTGTPRALLENPGSEAVARLLGDFNIFPAEILSLDPGRQSSRVRATFGEESDELTAPYLPGCFLGDRISLCVRSEEMRLRDRPGENRTRVKVRSVTERSQGVRVDLGPGKLVDIPRQEWQQFASGQSLWLEIPACAIRHLRNTPR